MDYLRILKRFAGKYAWALICCPIVMIGEVLMETLIPKKMSELIDEIIPGAAESGSITGVLICGALMVLISLVSMAFGIAGSRLGAIGGMGFAANLRSALFKKVQTFSFKSIDKFSTSSIVTRLTTDVNQMQNTTIMMIKMAFRAPFQMICALVMALTISPRLSMVMLVSVPILLLGLILVLKIAHPRFRAMLDKYDGLNASVQENLIAIRVVKAFVRSRHEKEKFEISADDVMNAQRSAEKIVLLTSPLMQITMYASICAVLFFGGNLIFGGNLKVGELSAFITYIMQVLFSLMMLSFLFISFVMTKASCTRVNEVLKEETDITSPEDACREVKDGSIVFDHVNFNYQGEKSNYVLQDINLRIASGETIGVIGATGSAKTTLVSLIPRLYDVTEGSVLVGGCDVRKYDLQTLRDNVSMVLQKNVLFSGSITENLRWGDAQATEEEITAACKIASADGFVRSFPDGYNMDLGQGGVNVSGGQKQRLCIARALLKKPKIMILDDATSAVDTATDASIRSALRNEMGDTTTIIIAQRIASVKDADRILVLDEGRISDIGTHDELMGRSSIYREVYESQQKGAE